MTTAGEREDAAFPVGAACRIDARTPWRQVAEIPVGLDPEGIAVDVTRRRAFVACSRSDFVSVVDLAEHEVIAEIPTGAEPIALGLDEQTKDVVPYYAAKWEMEQAVVASGLEHVVFRPSFVFGRDGGVLPTFVRLARFAPVTPIVGPGTQRLQPIWIEDLAEYYALAIGEPTAANRTFELGGPDAVTWNEFWERLKRVLGARRPSVHIPFGAMRLQATLTERLPGAPVTRDQLTMLELGDNVVTDPSAIETFGLQLVPLDEQLRRAT